jgi:hypothetical protein
VLYKTCSVPKKLTRNRLCGGNTVYLNLHKSSEPRLQIPISASKKTHVRARSAGPSLLTQRMKYDTIERHSRPSGLSGMCARVCVCVCVLCACVRFGVCFGKLLT